MVLIIWRYSIYKCIINSSFQNALVIRVKGKRLVNTILLKVLLESFYTRMNFFSQFIASV